MRGGGAERLLLSGETRRASTRAGDALWKTEDERIVGLRTAHGEDGRREVAESCAERSIYRQSVDGII